MPAHLLCIVFVCVLLATTIIMILRTKQSESFEQPRVTLQYTQPPFLGESSQMLLNYDVPSIPTDWPPYLVQPQQPAEPAAYFIV
jgi:hypothetical protein